MLHLDDDDASDSEAPSHEVSIDAKHGRVAGVTSCVTCGSLDVRTRVAENALSRETADDLVKDCEAAFVGDSFWLGVDAQPRCALEHLARAVFVAHAGTCASQFDASETGAEWWVQLRKDTDRDTSHTENPFNPLAPDDRNDPAGVSFHWDKDESLVDDYGVNVHPAISTVTYVTNAGAPTLVCEKTAPVMYEDADGFRGVVRKAVLSHPETGKHLSFDGRMLHGAPRELARTCLDADEQSNSVRVSFLVNVWLGHKPRDAREFPEEALGEFREASSRDARWSKIAAEMEKSVRETATADVQCVDVAGGGESQKKKDANTKNADDEACFFEYAFGETGTEHVLRIPRLGLHTARDWVPNGGTVALLFGSEKDSRCTVEEHPSRRRRRSRRAKR